jgi:transposase
LVWLYAIHDIRRVPRVQEFVSSCRFGTCARESAGKRSATSGTKLGNAALQWAFSEAAVLCVRAHPAGQQSLARLEKNPSKGNAFTIPADKFARAAYALLKRHTAFEMATFLRG